MNISCRFCGKKISISEYEYAMFCKGTPFYCEECVEKFEKGITETRWSP